jgi:hypothetical protein
VIGERERGGDQIVASAAPWTGREKREEERMAAVPAPDLRGMTDDEIWDRLHGGMVDSPLHRQCILMLEMRNTERQTQALTEQAAAARETSAATKDLAAFTKGLVGATRGLFAVAAATGALTVVQVLIALRIIGR